MLIHNLHLALIIYAILSTSHFSQLQSSKLLRSTHDVPRNKTRFRYIILISLDKLFYNFNQYLRTNPVVMLILICSYYSSYSIVQDVRFIFSAAKSISLRYDKAVSTVWKGSQWLWILENLPAEHRIKNCIYLPLNILKKLKLKI